MSMRYPNIGRHLRGLATMVPGIDHLQRRPADTLPPTPVGGPS
jgi:hypothetical protein